MVININPLSAKSVADAIKQIEDYRFSLDYKVDRFMQELYGLATAIIEEYVGKAKGDPNLDRSYTADHDVKRTANTSEMTIKVKGEDLVFIEFGAGIHYNGGPDALGKSPHPKGMEFGFWIGSYSDLGGNGYSYGQYDQWFGYQGTESTAPVYQAAKAIREQAGEIATRVFGENEWEWG